MFGIWKLTNGLFFSPDGDAGSSTGTEPGGQSGTDAGVSDPVDGKPGSNSGKDAKGKKIEWSPEQQEEINRIVGQTRIEEREKAKKDSEAHITKAKKEAEEKELLEKQEFKTLAEKREKELEELRNENVALKEAKEQGDKYKTALETSLKAQTDKLPKSIQALISKLDVLEQIEFLTKNAKDLGVKFENVDETPRDTDQKESEILEAQAKEVRKQVKNMV